VSLKRLWAYLLRFVEPPGADPHARWCGEGGRNERPRPIYMPLSIALRHFEQEQCQRFHPRYDRFKLACGQLRFNLMGSCI
jgi:hypothetical protein